MAEFQDALKLYEYRFNCGRMGTLEGIFVTTDNVLATANGQQAYFGEALGKHSEIVDEDFMSHLKLKSDDQDFLDKLVEVFGTYSISGYNPLEYLDGE